MANLEGRTPPHDLDAEAAVLSAVMVDPEAFDKVGDVLEPEHFYAEAHRRIFEACVALHEAGQPVDVVQVGTWLKNRERIANVGGMGYLTEVLNSAPAIGNVRAYGLTVVEKWRVRQMIAALQRFTAEGYVDYGEAQDFLAKVAEEAHRIAHSGQRTGGLVPLKDVIKESFQKITDMAASGSKISGISTGFDEYDTLTGGLHDGDLTIIAARPAMGKTSVVLQMAANGSQGGKIGVPIFTMEMPSVQIANRMTCADGRVDVSKMRTGALLPEDWKKLTGAATRLSQLPIWVDDTPGITLMDVRARVRRVQAEFDRFDKDGKPLRRVGIVVVDYLQLMRGRNPKSREQEVSELSRGLKELAKELKVAMVALSQLNRAVESRTKDKRPLLSDLRESGAIEQDADNVVFVYRDEYYDPETADKGIAELIVAKQRNGPPGTAKTRFDPAYTRFDNLAEGDRRDWYE